MERAEAFERRLMEGYRRQQEGPMNDNEAVIVLRELVTAHGEQKHKDALKMLTQTIDTLRADKHRMAFALRDKVK